MGEASVCEPRVGCGAAIVRGGGILLLQRLKAPEAGHWGLAGGKIDLFETAQAAAEREILEELGIVIQARDLLCFVDQIDREAGTHWVSPVYLVRAFTGEPANVEPAKHGGIGWFALDDLPAPLTLAAREAIAALAARGRSV
jgi:ADP-ribose pyrophosphatase YjhB (NUDIX family)